MVLLRQITEPQHPDAELVVDLVRVFREARREHLAFLLDLHDAQEDQRYLSGTMLPENQVWVAQVDGRLAGFIAFAKGWVNHLYVAPEVQRQGVGSRLLGIAAGSSPELNLWVFEVNEPAIRFYQKHGFRVVERTNGAANEARMPDLRMEWRV